MINFGFLSLDILIFLILIIFLVFLSFKMGKKFLYSLILAFYPAVMILNNLPYVELRTNFSKIIGFIFIYIICNMLIWKNLNPKNTHSKISRIFEYIILTVSFLILISTQIYLNSIYFSKAINNITEAIPLGISFMIPLIVILITTKRNNY